jgi:hypothetical protein
MFTTELHYISKWIYGSAINRLFPSTDCNEKDGAEPCADAIRVSYVCAPASSRVNTENINQFVALSRRQQINSTRKILSCLWWNVEVINLVKSSGNYMHHFYNSAFYPRKFRTILRANNYHFVQNCLLGYTPLMKAVRTSETSVDNHFTRQYIPEDNSEHHTRRRENLKSHNYHFLRCNGDA